MFGPYTPLQQLDLLADDGTKSYVVGSTNSLLLQQKDRYSDILINVSTSPQVNFWTSSNRILPLYSLTKTASTSHLCHSALHSHSPWLIDAGSIFSLR